MYAECGFEVGGYGGILGNGYSNFVLVIDDEVFNCPSNESHGNVCRVKYY